MRTDIVSFTERLVEVDTSPGRSTSPLVGALADELRSLGAAVSVQDGEHAGVAQRNLIARFGGDAPAGLVLAGHLDTVPWDDAMRATTRPERDGRRLFGRGAVDMKGPIAAQVEAVAASLDALGKPVVLAFTYAEEVGCHGALHLVERPDLAGDLRGAVCLVGEPTGLRPIVEHKGYGVARVIFAGVPAHSSNPWKGADASAALGRFLVAMHGLRDELRDAAPTDTAHDPPSTVLNTGIVSAGTARNVVPDRAEVSLEFRPLPGTDLAAFRARVRAELDAALADAPGVAAEIDWYEDRPAFAQDAGAPLVSWLVERTRLDPGVVPFYTEAEIFRGGLAVPTVVCGPGSIDQAHRVDESITFDELESGVAFYTDAVRAFCG